MLLVGLIILVGIALIMYVRRVDPAEVAATLFFLPVFMGFLYWGMKGGLAVGVLAALGYVALRLPAIEAVGAGRFLGLIAARTLGYLAFGGVGGWAVEQLGANIAKLDLYDHVDDETKLGNSRSFVETVERERSRCKRYEEAFSVCLIAADLADVEQDRRSRLMLQLGEAIRSGVRAADSASHARQGGTDLFAVVLPETKATGVASFSDKLTATMSSVLAESNVAGGRLTVTTATYPDDEAAALEPILDRVRAIVRADFPETAAAK